MSASNTAFNTCLKNKDRIASMVEENVQTAAVEGSSAQGHPPSPNDINLNRNTGWKNNDAQNNRSHINSRSNNADSTGAQRKHKGS